MNGRQIYNSLVPGSHPEQRIKERGLESEVRRARLIAYQIPDHPLHRQAVEFLNSLYVPKPSYQ